MQQKITGKAKILVVDDDPDMREALAMMLEPAGFQVIEAKDGDEALFKLTTEKPNLMLLDLLMPRKDGFAVLKELQEDKWRAYDSMPILVLSSVREEPARRRYYLETAVEFDVDDYIEKPVSPVDLVQRIKSALVKTSTARQR